MPLPILSEAKEKARQVKVAARKAAVKEAERAKFQRRRDRAARLQKEEDRHALTTMCEQLGAPEDRSRVRDMTRLVDKIPRAPMHPDDLLLVEQDDNAYEEMAAARSRNARGSVSESSSNSEVRTLTAREIRLIASGKRAPKAPPKRTSRHSATAPTPAPVSQEVKTKGKTKGKGKTKTKTKTKTKGKGVPRSIRADTVKALGGAAMWTVAKGAIPKVDALLAIVQDAIEPLQLSGCKIQDWLHAPNIRASAPETTRSGARQGVESQTVSRRGYKVVRVDVMCGEALPRAHVPGVPYGIVAPSPMTTIMVAVDRCTGQAFIPYPHAAQLLRCHWLTLQEMIASCVEKTRVGESPFAIGLAGKGARDVLDLATAMDTVAAVDTGPRRIGTNDVPVMGLPLLMVIVHGMNELLETCTEKMRN